MTIIKLRFPTFVLLLALTACVSAPPPHDISLICEGPCPNAQNGAANLPNEANDSRFDALKASAQTQPKAAYDLGLRYFRGDGVPQDSYQALKWMRVSAEHGQLEAQKALGVFYLFGLEEMGSDSREAEKWLSIAASRGDRESKKLLEQARVAKQDDADDYKAYAQWRDVYRGDWNSGYAYFGTWQQTTWYWQ